MKTNLVVSQPATDRSQSVSAIHANHYHISKRYDQRAMRKHALSKASNFDVIRALYQANTQCAQAQMAQINAENAATIADASNKAKSQFLADMSHEIRTPLGAIVGLARLLMTTPLDSKQKACLAMLQGCADDLMGMLNKSLDIDKIEAGAMDLDHTSFGLHALLSSIVGLMSVKSQEKNIRLTLHHAIGNYGTFVGDSGRIRQILMNLISNAIKFTKTGGVDVSLTLGNKENGKQTVSIAVADSGIGMTEDQVKAIFQRFAQADPSIRGEFGGTGLGLSIAKAMAESMGGSIGVSSSLGKGSVFTLTLPLALEAIKEDRKSINCLAFDQCQTAELESEYI